VIGDGVDFEERRVVVLEDAGDVGVELAAFALAEERATVLGAENEVDEDVGEGFGHGGNALSGLEVLAGWRSWASARCARFSPGCNRAGLQP